MSTAKDQISEIIRRQPDDSTYDEIVRELAFEAMGATRSGRFRRGPHNIK